uniref:Uncharacterized protein MANES_12G077000 n=1 Tax=Rhizophora mucronata TaxID=61149 RepID=A0A2P2MY78_RHIMU
MQRKTARKTHLKLSETSSSSQTLPRTTTLLVKSGWFLRVQTHYTTKRSRAASRMNRSSTPLVQKFSNHNLCQFLPAGVQCKDFYFVPHPIISFVLISFVCSSHV